MKIMMGKSRGNLVAEGYMSVLFILILEVVFFTLAVKYY